MQPVVTVGFVGAGNLAWNLTANLSRHHFSVEQVISRTSKSAAAMAAEFDIPLHSGRYADLHPNLDLVFVSTNDHEIEAAVKACAPFIGPTTIVAHCSGSIGIEVLAQFGDRKAVFWPMQTLTKSHIADFKGVPVFIEGQPPAVAVIRDLANSLSEKVVFLDSAQRLRLHLGAVITGNFSNLLYSLADSLVEGMAGVDFSVFEPLIRETLAKAVQYGPRAAQTGPARRGDEVTIQKHLALLNERDPELAELYRRLSGAIAELYTDEND